MLLAQHSHPPLELLPTFGGKVALEIHHTEHIEKKGGYMMTKQCGSGRKAIKEKKGNDKEKMQML